MLHAEANLSVTTLHTCEIRGYRLLVKSGFTVVMVYPAGADCNINAILAVAAAAAVPAGLPDPSQQI